MDMDGPAAHRTDPPGHVEVEDLAALVEGQLPPEDGGRVRAHLAGCEDCYEIFADMVRFLEEDKKHRAVETTSSQQGTKVKRSPFFNPSRGSIRFWQPAAAAAVLVLGVWIGYRASFPPMTISGTSEYLPFDVASEDLVPQDVYRGGGQADPLAFRVGIELVDFQAALKSGDVELAKEAAGDVADLFVGNDLYQTLYQHYFALSQSLSAKDMPEMAVTSAQYADSEMRDWFESPKLEFGIWAEAARLAAESQQPEFFNWKNGWRRSRFARDEALLPETQALLRGLKEPWKRREYSVLAEQLKEIIQIEYGRGEF